MMKCLQRKHHYRIIFGGYLLAWLITALVGLPQIDRKFDEELATGSVGFGDPESIDIPVTRLDFFDPSDSTNLPSSVPDTPWRCRSRGIAIAPFLIIDEAAWQDHVLSGFAGKRLVFWFFGFSRWTPITHFWVS